jgi:hypothetical protein
MITDTLPKLKSEKSVGRLHVVWKPLDDCYGRCWSQGGPDLVVLVPKMLNPIYIVLNEIKFK